MVFKVHQDHQVTQEKRESQAIQEKTVSLDTKDQQERTVSLDIQARMDIMERTANQVTQVRKILEFSWKIIE